MMIINRSIRDWPPKKNDKKPQNYTYFHVQMKKPSNDCKVGNQVITELLLDSHCEV